MFCKIICFYENNLKILENEINKNKVPFRIVTNSSAVYDFFKIKEKNVHKINKIIPDVGKEAWEIFRNAEKNHKEYFNRFSNIQYKNVGIFHGFEYPLLRQLHFLSKIDKILHKNENTIFIFRRYYPIYFAIIENAKKMNYQIEPKIGLIEKDKIEYLTNLENSIVNKKNKFSKLRIFNYLKSTQTNSSNFYQLKQKILFLRKILYFKIKNIYYQIQLKITSNDYTQIVLNKIDKKIDSSLSKFNAECAIFITASRDDIYLRPWLPILRKFSESNTPFHIFTSDLISGMALSKEQLSIINLFEEVNMLADKIRENIEGHEFKNQVNKIVKENNLIGINQLKEHILNQGYRTIALIAICEHLIKKMKLKSIILAADGEMLENISNQICQKNKIPSYAIIWGQLEEHPLLSHWFHAEKIFVEGERLVNSMINIGYDKQRMIVTGNPINDHIKKIKSNESKTILKNKFRISDKNKLIVIAMSRIHNNDSTWMSKLVKFCNNNNFEIVIKLHPAYKLEEDSQSTKLIQEINKQCKKERLKIVYDEINLYTLLSGSDLVITEYSDIGYDAILLKKPMITVNFLNEDHSQFVEFHKSGASINIKEYAHLEKTILEILNKKMHLNNLESGRQQFAKEEGIDFKLNASKKIFEILTK
jgi:hypothetical protein